MSIFAFRPLRWAIVVLLFVAALPGRSQDGYKYVGKFASGHLIGPTYITTDPDTGKIYVSDSGVSLIRVFSSDWVELTQFNGGSGSVFGSLSGPMGLVIRAGKLYVSDSGNRRVQVLDSTSGLYLAGWGNASPTPASVDYPNGIAWLPSGKVAVSTGDSRVKMFTPDGVQSGEIGSNGPAVGQFNVPFGLDADADGNIYVADANNGRIQKFTPNGAWLASFGSGGTSSRTPFYYGLAVRGDKVYVADEPNKVIKVFSLSGAFLYEVQSDEPMGYVGGVAFDASGRLMVVDTQNKCVRVFEPYYIDPVPPSSSGSLSPEPDASGWTRGTTLSISASDDANGTGVKEIRYTIGTSPVVVVPGASTSVLLAADGVYAIKYWAVDNAGNAEASHSISVKVDRTLPVSQAVLNGRIVSVSATDAGSGVKQLLVSVDNGAEAVYSGPLAFDALGEHTVTYRAVDVAGNSEAPRTLNLPGYKVVKLAVVPSVIKGGGGFTALAVLSSPAPSGGIGLSISSDSSIVAGASVQVPEGEILAIVSMSAATVSTDKTVLLSTSLGASSTSASVTVLAEPMKLSVTPADIVGGANTLGSVTLISPAPSGGTKVTLTSSSLSVVVPSSVVVQAGRTSAVFTVRTKTVSATSAAQVTAKAVAWESVANITLRTPELLNIDAAPSEVGSGGTTTGTIHLSCPAPLGGAKVTLTSSSKNLVVPGTVVVAQGEVSADFTIRSLPVTSGSSSTVTASLNGVTKSVTINITMPKLQAVSFGPASVTGGSQAKGTVSLNGAATATLNVSITSNNAALVPAQTVVIPKGKALSAILLKTNGVGTSTTVVVMATAGGVSVSADLILLPQPVTSVKLDKSSVKGGTSVSGTVSLATPAAADTVVRVSVSPTGVVTVPATVVVAKGSKTSTFTVLTNQTETKRTVTISAESDGVAKTAVLTVLP